MSLELLVLIIGLLLLTVGLMLLAGVPFALTVLGGLLVALGAWSAAERGN